jgi:hypothetical protein
MAKQTIGVTYDDAGFPSLASSTAVVSASGGVVTVKAGAGRLHKIIVTVATTTTAVTVYDNASAASGTVLAVIPAAATAGTVYDINLPALNGITVNGAAAAGSLTFGYA